jgi:outer membrane protein assembly factor BamB
MKSATIFGLAIVIVVFLSLVLVFWPARTADPSQTRFSGDTIAIHSNLPGSKIRLINSTFLGGVTRNYYGDRLPSKLNEIWSVVLGQGETVVTKEKGVEKWSGAGWTGQPLIVEENGEAFLIIGAYDHHLKKFRVSNGELIWQYAYDDIIKGTGTIWHNPNARCPELEYVILQGSRLGVGNSLSAQTIPSYRAISLKTGKAIWKFNIRHTRSYSRDVDGSALVVGDTVYIGLENGIFTVFNADPNDISIQDGLLQPDVKRELMLYEKQDIDHHGGNLVTESSPCLLNGHIYVTSGSGHVYGYNIKKKTIDWDFPTGSDMDGSPVVTSDSCILIPVEKQYIQGRGGILKLDPHLQPAKSVKWFFPTADRKFADWEGGIIGSASVNYRTLIPGFPEVAAFTAIDGYLYVVHQNITVPGKLEAGPDGQTKYPVPQLLFKYKTGPAISTPILIGDRLLAAGYNGIYLFGFDKYMHFTLLDKKDYGCEASPFAYKGRVYIASRNGKLYCFGE